MTNIQQQQQQQTTGDLVGTNQDRGIHRAGEASRYNDHERAMLRALGGLDEASDGDLDMLKAFADKSGLDPFTKEIYLIGRKTQVGGYRGETKRWETKWTVQTGIEGFRKAAGRYAASLGEGVQTSRPIYFDEDGNEYKIWPKSKGKYPYACEVSVTIGKSTGTQLWLWEEIVQTKDEWVDGKKTGRKVPNSQWETMPCQMIKKCCEAGAIRQVAGVTAGLYLPEEMRPEPVQMEATRMDEKTIVTTQENALQAGMAAFKGEAKQIEQSQPQPSPIVHDTEPVPAEQPGQAMDVTDAVEVPTLDDLIGRVKRARKVETLKNIAAEGQPILQENEWAQLVSALDARNAELQAKA